MSLAALQRDFRRDLLAAESPARGHASDGFAVYHNAYRAQLADCLGETFPKTLLWLGGTAFADAACDYIEHCPPTSWTLGDYGDGFDATLASLYPDDPEVAELAHLEWMLSRAFEGEDANALPASKIAEIDWDDATLIFVPTLRTCPALTNAGAIWSALASDDPLPASVLLPQPATMLVWRQDFVPCFRVIDTAEHTAIANVRTGVNFADLCEAMVDNLGEEHGLARAGGMLGQWMADGLIHQIQKRKMRCD
jgi:Putative DNA-binding domain